MVQSHGRLTVSVAALAAPEVALSAAPSAAPSASPLAAPSDAPSTDLSAIPTAASPAKVFWLHASNNALRSVAPESETAKANRWGALYLFEPRGVSQAPDAVMPE
jgi:hypothetical protein